jgi:hypothetical protein
MMMMMKNHEGDQLPRRARGERKNNVNQAREGGGHISWRWGSAEGRGWF